MVPMQTSVTVNPEDPRGFLLRPLHTPNAFRAVNGRQEARSRDGMMSGVTERD